MGGSQSKASPGSKKKHEPYSKITKTKRAGGLVYVVDHLPNKYKALSSNPNTAFN
jgi:hypothetical protein